MAAPAVFPALFCCLAAFVLLIIVTVSAPVWDKISFLDANIGGKEVHFGTFGFTGSHTKLGYPIDVLNTKSGLFNSTVVHNLTFVLILHPIAAAFALLATIFGFCGLTKSRAGTTIMAVCASIAAMITLVVWVIDMVLFGITRNKLRNQGYEANYGNANWMVLGAMIALFVGFCTGICGIFGSYRTRRAGEKF